MSPRIGSTLVVFRHQVIRQLMGRNPRQKADGIWVYPPLAVVMAEAGMEEVETYIAQCHKTVTDIIMIRPIMDLCLAAERHPGERVYQR